MPIALTRQVSESIADCELTHMRRHPIDLQLAREQHTAYETCLQDLGCQVRRVPAEPELPDAVFVEDTAIVLDELAVITRPGAASRRAETESMIQALAPYRPLKHLTPPATLDGGDVLVIDKTLYAGLSSRTNRNALSQLQCLLGPYGYEIVPLQISSCLHLKSAVTQVSHDTVLLNPQWISRDVFGSMQVIEVDPDEAYAANALWIHDTVIYPASFPATKKRLESAGLRVHATDMSELAKAEGAVTCCSIIFDSTI